MATLEKPRQKKKRAVPSIVAKSKTEHDKSKESTEEVPSTSKDVIIKEDVVEVLSEVPSTFREADNVPVEQNVDVTEEKLVEEYLKLAIEENVESNSIDEKPIVSSSHCDTENSVSEATKEHQEATAPIIDEPAAQEIVAYPKLPFQECSKTVEPVILPSEIVLKHIKPYTISQLGALYYNQELTVAKSFETQLIEQELASVGAKQHTLYDLITRYIRARDKLKENFVELTQLRSDCDSLQEQIWNLEHATVHGKANCQDGVPVVASHRYLMAKLQRPVLESLARTQLKIKKLAHEAYTLHAYTCASLRIKIENYLGKILTACKTSPGMTNSSVTLQEPNFSNQEIMQASFRELRICISVLFIFQRQLHKDQELVTETRAWLADCVAVLLRAADWQDHIYLLVQVLRCPAGVGQWAAPFVQVPSPVYLSCRTGNESPFANRFVNHIVTILSIILSPIDKRDAFLEQMWNSLQLHEGRDAVAENLWVLVDSDGEEDEPSGCGAFALKENDLVAFLNQIPMDDLFRTVLLIDKKDNKDIYAVENVTEHHMLRLLAFSTVLISLIDKGLSTYHVARYHQFAKRLCRMIRHCLQYVSDTWEAFKSQNKIADAAMLDRLQTEFDAFFLRATSCLFHAQSLGAWQFLAVAPFHTVSLQVLWRFFYILHQGRSELDDWEDVVENLPSEHVNFKSKLSEGSIRQQFCERLLEMSVEESYYLLNTFANMIMARPAEDVEFIQFATLNLLQIGFSGAESQESCRRCAAILLANITSRYPYLISDILGLIRNNINDLKQLPFLFSELPLWLWHPAETDLVILRGLLLQNALTSVESYLARKILSNLNWDFCRPGELFLPLKMHRDVAVLVGEAMYKYATNADSANFLDGVKQAVSPSNLSPEQNLARWSWQLVYQLHLHASDRDTSSVQGIPELVTVDVLQSGVREQQPLACFLTLQMTSVGHLLPVVCSQGLEQLEVLTGNYKHDAVLISLFNIVPLFVDCPDNLIMCTSFQNILQNLLNADRTYMKIAKSFIGTDFPGTVLKHFGNMIEMQTRNPKWRSLIIFWAKSFISLPNWNRDPGVLYLLNLVIRTGFFIPEACRGLEVVFNELLEKAVENAASNSSLLSWVPLVGNSTSSGSSLLLQGPNVGATEPWLIFLIISLEHQHVEVKTGLWSELLRQLFATSGKTNIDQSLKKAANVVKIPSYTSAGLCLYRWAQVAVDTDLNHPLLPLIWQKFFSLYLARVPGSENRGSVGSKFFDGMVNTSFCKKLKKRLQETVDFYNNILEPPSSEDQTPENISQTSRAIYQRCLALFKAYILWLEEPLLQEATLYLPSLPPQYEPRYLAAIVQNSMSPWMELINCEIIRSSYEKSQTEWFNMCNRMSKRRPPIQKMGGAELKEPVERILRRLTSYDKPLPAPPLKNKSSLLPMVTIPNAQSVITVVQPYVKWLQQFAENYSLQVSEHGALDGQYKELVQQLYNNFQTKISFKKTCKGMCAGAGIVTMTFCEARENESIKLQIQTNRTNFSSLLTRSVLTPANNLCINCCTIEEIASLLHTNLFESINRRDQYQETQLRTIGVEYFYYLFSSLSDDLKTYPPTHQIFQSSLENLGHAFLLGVESETIRLCRTIFNEPKKASLLTPHFIAVNLGTVTFLQLYSEICEKVEGCPIISLALLSKFDIYNWLTTKNPRLADRTKFIHLIFQSLTKLGPKTSQVALQETFRRHLLAIFRFDFPEHYGEVLMQALQCSGQQTLALAVWLDLLNALSHPVVVHFGSDILSKQETLQLRRHATEQKMLQHRELDGTVTLLARYFAQERLQFGLYGLYPKYRSYGDALCLLLGLTLHAFIVSTLNAHSGDLGERLLAEHLWPRLLDAFAPWLIPYAVKDCKDTAATWIQQLTDDRSVLLPWIQADISHAQKMFHMFINCIAFIGETLPACNNLLCYVWQFYATHFTHAAVKEHIYTVVHSSLLLISWERFWPSLTDLEIMLKVVDTYLPECHAFLGHIFLEVNWNSWLARLVQQTTDLAPSSRVHHCLLHLLVKLSSEQTVRQNDKARVLLERAREFSTWHVLEVQALEHALDWYVMSCDPRVVLHEASAVKLIDYQVFGLLRVVSCYDNVTIVMGDQLSVTKKRQCFLRAFIKLLGNCSNRHKSLLSNQAPQFEGALGNQLNHIEGVINNTLLERHVYESDLLVTELLAVFNNTSLSPIALTCFTQWIEKRSFHSVILCSILRVAGNVVTSAECLSSLLEVSCTAYFSDDIQSVSEEPNWSTTVRLLNMGPPKQPPLETILISSGRLLTLYAILLKKIGLLLEGDRNSVEILLESVVNWLIQIKANEVMESKLPLLWREAIRLSLKVCHLGGEDKVASIVRKFVHSHLLPVSESKGGGTGSGWGRGLLGAIGLMKQGSVSVQFRFLCKAMAGYLLAQLPEARGEAATVRCFAGASGPVGQPGGNVDCAKVLLKLDVGGSNAELKSYVELALKQIQDPQNSLHSAEQFLFGLVNVLYSKTYLRRF